MKDPIFNYDVMACGLFAPDRKEKTALFGRDRFGKKPFFYHLLNENKLVFASEMKALFPFLNSIEPNENINIYLQKLLIMKAPKIV